MGVVVVGSINVDVTARVPRLPHPGETLLAGAGWIAPGGKGANQAVAARRQGVPTRMVGHVGRDAFARTALALLEESGVDLSWVEPVAAPTGLALIWLQTGGENTITVIPGANSLLAPSRFDPGPPLEPGDVVLVSLEVPLPAALAAVEWARRQGATTLLDPAPVPATWPPTLSDVDVLMPNVGEAEALLGQPIRDVRDAKEAARALRRRGARVGMVKMGRDGVAWATRQGVFYMPAVSVEVVDTTGAGDAFAGVLAAALARGTPLADAVRRAQQAAAIACTREGAQPSFPTQREVDAALRA
jgi:ribokinase